MIQFTHNLWVGNSNDAMIADVGCILNVAKDLRGVHGWPKVQYIQVGLVDGPGNPHHLYYAAVMALDTLMNTGNKVLVHCHEGKSRSVTVALMYMNLTYQRTLSELIEIVEERTGITLSSIHQAHYKVFDTMDWSSLKRLIETQQ